MSAGSVTAAMTRTGPAQRGQYLKSIANTRRRRCIQVMGAVARVAPSRRDEGGKPVRLRARLGSEHPPD